MRFSVLERIAILNQVFPKEADFVGVRVMKAIRKKLDFETKEIKEINLHPELDPATGQSFMSWDPKAKDIEVKFDALEVKFLRENVERLDREKKVNEQIMDLCDKVLALKE